MKKHFGYIGILFLISSCLPDPIDIKLKPFEPKLVVASQIIPNQIMLVSLTKSFSALSNSTQNDSVSTNFLDGVLVKNAFITVSYFNTVDTLFMLTPGIYAGFNVLQYDYGFYTLHAKDPSSGMEISASSTMLPLVRFDTISPIIKRNIKDTTVYINYSFTDIPNTDNWYVINYYLKRALNGASLDINKIFNTGENKLINFELISDKAYGTSTITKETFLNTVKATDTLAVTISNISQGYCEFLTAYKRSGSLFNQLTGEPINYPTNVSNGYGFFNTHYPHIRIFYLKDY